MKTAGTLALTICIYLAAMSVWAHNRSNSVLRGRVTVDGQPLAHAAISLFLLRTTVPGAYGRNIVSRTNENGSYEVASLPHGDYVVLVWKHGIRLYQGRIHVGESDNITDIATASYRPTVPRP
jgi:Carboxypeptidase regulatory-like domain